MLLPTQSHSGSFCAAEGRRAGESRCPSGQREWTRLCRHGEDRGREALNSPCPFQGTMTLPSETGGAHRGAPSTGPWMLCQSFLGAFAHGPAPQPGASRLPWQRPYPPKASCCQQHPRHRPGTHLGSLAAAAQEHWWHGMAWHGTTWHSTAPHGFSHGPAVTQPVGMWEFCTARG